LFALEEVGPVVEERLAGEGGVKGDVFLRDAEE